MADLGKKSIEKKRHKKRLRYILSFLLWKRVKGVGYGFFLLKGIIKGNIFFLS